MQTKVLIIGASISGLATAACLRRRQEDFVVIEKEPEVAAPWRHHYERLHLHTNKRVSGLPYMQWPASAPRYPSRLEVIGYLETYQRAFDIRPMLGTAAVAVRKTVEGWETETEKGTIGSKYVVMATGAYGKARRPQIPGQDRFSGRVLHSCDYRSGAAFAGQRVLVVGFGNSACEIAIDLVERGAGVAMSVRSAVNIVPRDILGIPVLELSLLLRHLPPRLADTVSRPLVRGSIGNLGKLGLRQKSIGPLEQIVREGKAPVLDIGLVKLIRAGKVGVWPGVASMEGSEVIFEGGRRERFDAIVAAIGYDPNPADIVAVEPRRFEDLRVGAARQQYFGEDGLYFCGYWISPTGQIREIARDAKRIAADIGRRAR